MPGLVSSVTASQNVGKKYMKNAMLPKVCAQKILVSIMDGKTVFFFFF
jgi:hypothetical protein